MLRKALAIIGCALGLLCIPAAAVAATYPAGFEERTLVSGLDGPTEVDWTPDGRMLIAEKRGVLEVLAPGSSTAKPILDISAKVNDVSDRGLLGLAVDSSFATNHYIYLLYTYDVGTVWLDDNTPMVSRLERYTLGTDNSLSAPKVLLGSYGQGACLTPSNTHDCIPSDGTSHSIGTVRSAPDGTLWVGSGDAASFSRVDPLALRTYDERTPAGKILHIDRDGLGVPGHPFCPTDSDRTHVCTKVWAKGFRNPFRFELRPNGGLTVGDVGWDTREEIDLIDPAESGRSYGWPCYEGSQRTDGYDALSGCAPEYAKEGTAAAHAGPKYDYVHSSPGNSVVGGPLYTGTQYPAGYRGSIFYGDFSQGWLKRLTVDSDGHVTGSVDFATDWAGTAIEQAPDGTIVYPEFGWDPGTGAIKQIVYTQGNRTPIAKAAGTPTSGSAPLKVAFSSAGSQDPDGDPLTYEWDFGDGTSASSAAAPTHTYTRTGNFTARLTIRDGRGLTGTATVPIAAGNTPPVPTFAAPADRGNYTDGQLVTLSGSATDAQDGTLPGSAISWRILLHHGQHTHPFNDLAGAQASFTPLIDHDADAYYEITMTARDSGGLTATRTIRLDPRTVKLQLASQPAGAPISYSGFPSQSAPVDRDAAIAYSTSIAAGAEFTKDGRRWAFDSWSDGGARLHDVVVPARDSTLTAIYRDAGPAAVPAGLVGAWGFDEGSGTTARDASGRGNDGVLTGAAWTAWGRHGGALSFDGMDDWVTVADAASLDLTGPMTLEAWVRPDTTQGWRTVLLKEDGSGDELAYALYGSSAGGPSGWTRSATAWGTQAVPTNAWTHLAYTYDGSTARLFVDGVETTVNNVTATAPDTSRPLRIGGNAMWSEFFDGLIDEVRVYDRPLTTAQIATDMQTPVGGAQQPAVDATPPAVAIAGPAGGSTVNGSVSVAANASDDVGVSAVQFQLDGQDLGAADSSAPYEVSWDTRAAADGTHRLTAVARDAAGNTTTSSPVTVTVNNAPPPDTTQPDVAVTAPRPGATVAGSVGLAADAGDDVGVASVQFRVDGQDVGAPDGAAPYSLSWDSRTVAAGEHTVTAVARDAAGNARTSAGVAVTIENGTAAAPVGAWSFDEGSGKTARDASGRNNDGALSGAAWTSSGRYGKALSFDGVNDWVTVADAASLDLSRAMTLEAWVRPDTTSGWRTVLLKEDGSSDELGYALYGSSSDGAPSGWARRAAAWGPRPVAKGRWTHLAYTYDGTTARLYVDGVLTTTNKVSSSAPNTSRPLRIGGNAMWSGEFFDGLIDEVRVYDKALTATQVATDMQTPIGGAGRPVDTTPPTVGVTAPAGGTAVDGAVQVAANASDDTGVTSVQFKLDGQDLGTADPAAPYAAAWDTRLAPNGDHVLTAVARDAAGNASTSAPVTVRVANQAAPAPPVGAWGFEEGSGAIARDASGHGNDGTVAGATWAAGRFGRALDFDGVDDWVTVADATSLDLTGPMTLEAWVRPRAVSDWGAVLLKEAPGDYMAYALYGSTFEGGPSGWTRDASAWSSQRVPTSGWTHLAYTYDGTTARLYVGGVQVTAAARTDTAPASSLPLRFGGDAMWPHEFWNGLLDEIRVYDRSLSPAEITTDMKTAIGPAPAAARRPAYGKSQRRRAARPHPRRVREKRVVHRRSAVRATSRGRGR